MNFKSLPCFFLAVALGSNALSHAETSTPSRFAARQVLSGTHFEHWTGLDVSASAPEATIQNSASAQP